MAPSIDKSMRLPPSQYFPSSEAKSGIALHHTVGGSAKSTFEFWKGNADQVGTAYIIDRDGTIYEVFEPDAWAWQFGLRWAPAEKIAFEKRFIGIEIASEGALTESGGQLYCFGTISPRSLKPRDEVFDCGHDYRGFRYFDRYEPAQMSALCGLVSSLCDTFHIPKQVPSNPLEFRGEGLKQFQGIIGHTMVRTDKTDPLPDPAFWTQVQQSCGLTFVDGVTPLSGGRRLSDSEIEQLFRDNAAELNRMNVAAGSMIKGLIMELERNGRATYIRLKNPVQGGHEVEYDLVQGDTDLVGRIGRALGLASVTESRLQVRS
jgi:hypothetical protein